jgi:hypothetical protein
MDPPTSDREAILASVRADFEDTLRKHYRPVDDLMRWAINLSPTTDSTRASSRDR